MSHIYLALDFADWDQTRHFLQQHQLQGAPVKIGMELFHREGPAIIDHLKFDRHPIFLDLKLHDIPTTVHNTMRHLARLGVDMINVHALGGGPMIEAARQGLMAGAGHRPPPKLIAVTLLTSLDEATIHQQLGLAGSVADNTQRLARLAHDSGADGVVCSVHEARQIKQQCGATFVTVTPGIRLADSATHDQARVANLDQAARAGADYPVIGRSITQADNPRQAYRQAQEHWHHA